LKPEDITLLTAIDAGYIDKLLATYETWTHFHPEVTRMPMIVLHDAEQLVPHGPRMRRLARMAARAKQADFRYVAWDGEYETQREKMLTGLTFAPELQVQTPWYLKIDADTVATKRCEWIQDEWFEPIKYHDTLSLPPAFVTNPWHYTKPAEFLDRLDDWGDDVWAMGDSDRLNIAHEPGARRAYHSRIISWLFFGNTEWTKLITGLLEDRRLPVPSQDTFLWYCAARGGRRYRTLKMRKYGWGHMGRRKNHEIAEKCRNLIDED
jgi:hypothetical protein